MLKGCEYRGMVREIASKTRGYWFEGRRVRRRREAGRLVDDEPEASGAMIGPEGVSAVGSDGGCAGAGFGAGGEVDCGGSGLTSPWLRVGDW